jgi:hypothetical protein
MSVKFAQLVVDTKNKDFFILCSNKITVALVLIPGTAVAC